MTSIMEIMQLCRFCLVKDQVNIPIFEEQGDIRQIFLKLTACLPVKVSKDDNLPKKICDGCLYKLELLYQFWNTTANAEKQLLTWLSQASMEAEAKAAQEVVTVVQQSQAHSVKQEAVEPVESTNENSDDLSTEAQNYILQQQQLPYEPETFTYQQPEFNEAQGASDAAEEAPSEELEEPSPKRRRRQSVKKVVEPEEPDEDDDDISQEMAITKTEEESDTEEETKIEGSEPTNFGSMGDSGDNEQPGPSGMGKVNTEAPRKEAPSGAKIISVDKNKLVMHIASQNISVVFLPINKKVASVTTTKINATRENETLTCEVCKKVFTDKVRFGYHVSYHRRKHRCTICGQSFTTINQLRNHRYTIHFPVPFNCEVCGKRCMSKWQLRGHKRTHDLERCFKCSVCGKKFKLETTWKCHMAIHSGHCKFKCDLCGKVFTSKHGVDSHKEARHFKVTRTCKICYKSISPSYYKQHVQLHNRSRTIPTFQCNTCDVVLTSKSGMKRHQESHSTNRMIYICEVCGKNLTTQSSLVSHSRTHTGEKPFVCELCDKSFNTRQVLRVHLLVHTREKPFVCKICDKRFSQKGTLNLHVKIHTGEKAHCCVVCRKRFTTKKLLKTHSRIHGTALADVKINQ